MSVIGYREWQIWKNMDFFEEERQISGVLYFKITPTMMAEQTINFFNEKLEQIRAGNSQSDYIHLLDFFSCYKITSTNDLLIQKNAILNSSANAIRELISNSLDELDTLSLCLDFSLTCNEIHFAVPPGQSISGEIFVASRKSIGRGLAFEVEERQQAFARLSDDFVKLKSLSDMQKVAVKHYLNGLTILGLEDQYSGLLDASFMQFYQACEVLGGGNYKIWEVKAHIAKHYPGESRTLQLIAHHVWQIRHNYFGHANVSNNITNLGNISQTFNAAKQVLVARWLSKRLLDLDTKSNQLSRDMLLYHGSQGIRFNGSMKSLISEFYMGYSEVNVKILDNLGNTIETVNIWQSI